MKASFVYILKHFNTTLTNIQLTSTQESSAVSEQLASRASELDGLVKQFKLYSDGK